MIRHSFLAVSIACLAAATAAQPVPQQRTEAVAEAKIAAAVDSYAKKALADWEVPGLAVAVVVDGRTVLQRGYGVLEIGKPAPVGERTRFNIGSASKAFTTALVAQLVDEKKLAWDDPVSKHLPELKLPPYASDVTLRDLASHRTGWGAASYTFIGADRGGLLERVQHLPKAAPLRSRLVYNNLGYSLLGDLSAKVAGAPSWEQLLRDRLFEPLGMEDAATYGPEVLQSPTTAIAHATIDKKLQAVEPLALDSVSPAGGIYASARDMASWMKMLLADGKAGERQVVSKDMIGLMQHMHMPLPVSGIARTWPSTHFYGYGLGWFVRDYRGIKVVEHGGNTAGKSAFVLLAPELDFGVTVMANADATDAPTAIAYRALDLAIGGESEDIGAKLLANREDQPAERASPAPAPLPLDRYAGSYASPLYGTVRIASAAEELEVEVGARLKGRLVSLGEHKFDVIWSDPYIEEVGIYDTLSFEIGEDGSPKRLMIEKLSNPMPVFERRL